MITQSMCPYPLTRALLRFYAEPSKKLAVLLVNAITKRIECGHPREAMVEMRRDVAQVALEVLNAFPTAQRTYRRKSRTSRLRSVA